MAETTKRRVTVSCLGDSMFDTMGEDCAVLSEALAEAHPDVDWRVRNHAVSGTRADYGLYRVTHDYQYAGRSGKSVAYDDPDIVILESFAYNHIIDREEGLEHYRTVLTRIVEALRLHTRAKILFVRTIPPDHDHFLESVPNFYTLPPRNRRIMAGVVDTYMAAAREWADGLGLPCADAYDLCLAEIARGVPHRVFIDPADNIHPSGYGHRFVARCIAEALTRAGFI